MTTPATPKSAHATVPYEKLQRALHALNKTIDAGATPADVAVRVDGVQPLYDDLLRDDQRRAAASAPLPAIGKGVDLGDSTSKFLDETEASKNRARASAGTLSRKDVQRAYAKAVTTDTTDPRALAMLAPEFLDDKTAEKLKVFQDLHDAFSFTFFCHAKNQDYDPRESPRWRQFKALHDELVMKNILTTTAAGAGAEFIPTLLSGQLVPLFRQALVVAADLPHMSMSGKTEELPLEGVTPFLSFVPESSSTAPPTSGTQIPDVALATGKSTLTAKKFAGLAILSAEATEDAVLNSLDFTRGQLAQAGGETVDSALINADASSTHMDDDVAALAATDHRKVWNGFRKLADATEGDVNAGGAAMNSKFVAQGLTEFGKFASFPSQLSLYLSSVAHVQLQRDPQYLGRDKMADQSSLLVGQVGVCHGAAVQVSGHVRRDLDVDGTQNSDTSSNVSDRTLGILVHRPSFMVGDRRVMQIEQVRDIWTDRVILMVSLRADFIRVQAESSHNRNVAVIRNILTTATLS